MAFVFAIIVVGTTNQACAWISTRMSRPVHYSLRMMITTTPKKMQINTENNPAGFRTHVLDHIDAALDTLSSRSNGRSLSLEEVEVLVASVEAIIEDAQSFSEYDSQTLDSVPDVIVEDHPAAPAVKIISSSQATETATTRNNREPKSYGTRSKLMNTNIRPTGFSSGGMAPAIADDMGEILDADTVATRLKPKSSSSNSKSTSSSHYNSGEPKSYGVRKYTDYNVKPTGYASGGLTAQTTTGEGEGEGEGNAVFLVSTVLVPESVDNNVVLSPVESNEVTGSGSSGNNEGSGLAPDQGACAMTMTGHPDFVLNVFQLLDGGLCSVDTKGTIKTWDLQTGQCQATMMGHSGTTFLP